MTARAWLLYGLALLCAAQTAQCCSCVADSFNRPRTQAIRDDFSYSSMVYTARVVGASCNCANGTILSCVRYTQSTGLSAEVVAMGECDGANFMGFGSVGTCANLNGALSVSTDLVIMPGTGITPVNLTAMAEFGVCPFVCPFNSEVDDFLYEANPCQYTLELLEVFKPQTYTGASMVTMFGPDVLSSCGSPGRHLNINETYMIGVGGVCNPIPEWPTLESFSTEEVCLLRELRADESRMCAEPTSATTGTATQTDGTAATGDMVTTDIDTTTAITDDKVTLSVGSSEVPVKVPSLLSLTLSVLSILVVTA